MPVLERGTGLVTNGSPDGCFLENASHAASLTEGLLLGQLPSLERETGSVTNGSPDGCFFKKHLTWGKLNCRASSGTVAGSGAVAISGTGAKSYG